MSDEQAVAPGPGEIPPGMVRMVTDFSPGEYAEVFERFNEEVGDATRFSEWVIDKLGRPAIDQRRIVADLINERRRQEEKFPNQHLPGGTNAERYAAFELLAKDLVNLHVENGNLTWADVLSEEFYEALAEEDQLKLRAELVQIMAVSGRWVEDIDREAALQPTACPTCFRPLDDHWTLAMSPEELEKWDGSKDICTLTRGDVVRLLEARNG